MSNRVCSVFVKLSILSMFVVTAGAAGCGGRSDQVVPAHQHGGAPLPGGAGGGSGGAALALERRTPQCPPDVPMGGSGGGGTSAGGAALALECRTPRCSAGRPLVVAPVVGGPAAAWAAVPAGVMPGWRTLLVLSRMSPRWLRWALGPAAAWAQRWRRDAGA